MLFLISFYTEIDKEVSSNHDQADSLFISLKEEWPSHVHASEFSWRGAAVTWLVF